MLDLLLALCRYIRIQLESNDYLCIAEVEAFATRTYRALSRASKARPCERMSRDPRNRIPSLWFPFGRAAAEFGPLSVYRGGSPIVPSTFQPEYNFVSVFR
jgi:hypothetical protein